MILTFNSLPFYKLQVLFNLFMILLQCKGPLHLTMKSIWRNYLSGQRNAITDNAKRGALLFYKTKSEGGFNCAGCHSGAFFSDEQFHVIAVPQIGRGKGDGPDSDDDFGRFHGTKVDTDKYAFRTPSLLNVAQTGPWGHSVAYMQLKQVVAHHLNPQKALQNYTPDNIQEGIQIDNWVMNTELALMQIIKLQSQGFSQLQAFTYTNEQLDYVVEFLNTLTDPCTITPSCMNKWVPSEYENDPDGTRLIAIDQNGNAL
jgi:cytochrome c peroxidase